ncbi:MAG: TonB-dependent receptor plug [Sphingobacteriaceae bacterium]|jgi:outer membrane receptor protein involved in Fe transport|nr:TonB-dependent receptor plug [Sphingobacteriaceae bacterium]
MNTRLTRTFALLIYVSTYINLAFGQTAEHFRISGNVSTKADINIQELTLQLIRSKDSSLVKVEFPSASGEFQFENIPAGEYRLRTAHVALAPYISELINLSKDISLGKIILEQKTNALKEVAVSANRPFIQQQFDKTVLNVESSIVSAGSTAMDVLEKAPGISVDQNDNLSMRGRQGILVMIDGKKVPMSGAELATMLRGMSASSIDKIELVTNPSAKYEAAGNSGIIDIKLKKDKRNGTNGSITSSFTQGKYAKTSSGFNINSRSKKLNAFASYNYGFRKEFNDLSIYRNFYNGVNFTGSDDQQNYFKPQYNSHNYRAGLDFYASPKTVIGFVASGFNLNIDRSSESKSTSINSSHTPTSYSLTDAESANNRFNPSLNVNFKQVLDTLGKEITADLDYASYNTNDDQNYVTKFFNLNNSQTASPYLLYGTLNGNLDIKSAKIDYTHPFKGKEARLEAGLKSSLVEADNNLQFFDRSNGSDVYDAGKSNHFLYKENINAAYVNVSKNWSKLSAQFGLRLENTQAKGTQLTNGENFDRSYSQLFPSGYIGYKFNAKHELGISVSRRINRPTYNQLNPFKYYINASTYSTGNPFLKPELTYSFEITHTYNQQLNMKYSYSRTVDNMISVLSLDNPSSNLVIQTDRNLALLNYYSFSLSTPAQITNWFTSTNNVTAYYGQYSGNLVNTNLRSGRATVQVNSNNNLTFSPTFSGEIVGTYQSREIYAFLDLNPIWSLSAGVQKQLWNKKASVKLNVGDMFYTNTVKATTRSNGYEEKFFQKRDTRTAAVSFTYKFGKSQGSQGPRKTGGAEEEKRRAN